jgi:hypothetical protein
MNVVKAFGLGLGDRNLLDGDELEAGLLDLGQNSCGIAGANGVGLDDAKGTL